VADLREKVVDRTFTLRPAVLEGAGRGEITSRVTEDLEDFVTAVPLVVDVLRAGVVVVFLQWASWRWTGDWPSPS
jgi:ATP-binding cassette, subfamily C, bacterial